MFARLLGTVLFVGALLYLAWLGTRGQRAKPSRKSGDANEVTPQ